jgi:UDP-glucose 4-epimerase
VLLLSQAIRRAGRPAIQVPSPAVSLGGSLFRRAGLVDFSPEQLRFLQFGRGVDTTRLGEDFGFVPKYTTVEAFDDFVAGNDRMRVLDPDRIARAERGLLQLATRGRPVSA